MTPQDNPLTAIIESLNEQIQTGVFTVEAVKRVDELRQKSEELGKLNEKLVRDKADLSNSLTALQDVYDALKQKAGNLDTREEAVKKAELQIAVDKKELELTRAFKDDMKTLLHTALRSPIVQTMMKDQMMTTYSNGPGQTSTCPMQVEKSSTVQEV